MTELIVKPPRAFQLSIVAHFPEDPRSDPELIDLLLTQTTCSLKLAGVIKAAGVQPIAGVPTGRIT